MKLENFELGHNYILVAIKEHSKVGQIELLKPITDKFTKLVAVGDGCQRYKLGEYVLLDDLQYLSMSFEIKGEKGPVKCILAREVNIIGKYTPDKQEQEIVLAAEQAVDTSDNTRELNVIDNPGIEKGSYLKEEVANKEKLTKES